MHFTPVPRKNSYRSMIVTPQPEATDAGAMVLGNGGNVVDAIVAASLVQSVVDPLMCGIGGMAVINITAPDGQRIIIDGLGSSPAAVTPDMWEADLLGPTPDGFGYRTKDYVNETGAQAIMTPGTLKTLAVVHGRFGSLPWSDLFGEALRLAESGWIVRPHLQTLMVQDETKYGRMNFGDKLTSTPDGQRIYAPSGGLPKLGDIISNPDLAEVLKHISAEGAEDFYHGELAQAISDSVQLDGGVLSADDLAQYTVKDLTPITGHYRGLELSLPPQPAGGVQTMQTLGIMNHLDFSTLDHNSPEHLTVIAEAMKHALRDKEDLWNRGQSTDDDYSALLDPSRLDETAHRIRNGEKVDVDGPRYESRNTTHLNAMDAEGFTVSMTHTLGNPSGYIPRDLGFMLNGGMSTFDPRPGTANSIEPGRRRNTTSCPTIVFDEAGPMMAIGAPGASWITPAIVQTISNVIDFGMNVQDSVLAPRAVATSNTIDISNRIPRSTELGLHDRGYEVRRSPLSYAFAGVHAITRHNGVLSGAADPQRDGYAAGVR